ncbi:SPW repeat protein [Pseudonocardia bannensis]|uniref:SPW repeat protein n=1 Tax=Pseudonocardia bannensis TaxID=630973 RepID=A0A848DQ90_9PSEU|nr:SPW repeat protein [Pseudonocardia bannensis]NMH94962.1 SPW repeat protein [Pseudonocardia bannensis]
MSSVQRHEQRHEHGVAGSQPQAGSTHRTEGPTPGAVTPSRGPRPGVRGAALRVLTLLCGVWLALAPFVLGHPDTGPGFDARWNDMLVGVAVLAVSAVQLALPARAAVLSLITMVLGTWLIAAPFVLGYNTGVAAVAATVNDVVVGILIVELAIAAVLALRQRRSSVPH